MIERYAQPEMTSLWSEQKRFEIHHDVECAALGVLFPGLLDKPEVSKWLKEVRVDIPTILKHEAVFNHETIAFCEAMTENAPLEIKRFYHYGMTSSDVLDTVMSIQIRESLKVLECDTAGLIKACEGLIERHGKKIIVGRSHGQYAEPMYFGHRVRSHLEEIKRRAIGLNLVRDQLTGKIGGPIGTNLVISRAQEQQILADLGLKLESVNSQIIPRDRVASVIMEIAGMAVAIERLALNLRLAAIEGISEAAESFSNTQRGSSAMPHKKNPILLENISGMCRYIRAQVPLALENNLLWFERDISHSSNERMMLPDVFHSVLHCTRRMTKVVNGLDVGAGYSQEDLLRTPKLFSATLLCEIVQSVPVARTEAYGILQKVSGQAKTLDEFVGLAREQLVAKGLDAKSLISPAALLEKVLSKMPA